MTPPRPSGTSQFALSTAWHAPLVRDPAEILRLTINLGFSAIEMSSLTADTVAALRDLLRNEALPVISIHAPCPVPYEGAARLDDLASADDRRRRAAVDYTRRTIDLAVDVGVRAVIIHLGQVPVSITQTTIVETMEAHGDESWRALLAQGLAERTVQADRHLGLALQSLEDLTAHLGGSHVRLAVETRYSYNELPNLDEFVTVLNLFGDRGVVYWHDVGHAHTQEVLGLATQRDYLNRFRDHLAGFHIHDARGTRDHLPPGAGEVDFVSLVSYLRPEHLRIFELASGHSADQVARSGEYLRAAGW